MKLHYYPENDSLYIDVNTKPSSDSREVAEGVDEDGHTVGIDIEHASTTLDLRTLEMEDLPAQSVKMS